MKAYEVAKWYGVRACWEREKEKAQANALCSELAAGKRARAQVRCKAEAQR